MMQAQRTNCNAFQRDHWKAWGGDLSGPNPEQMHGAGQVPAVSYAIFKHNQNVTSNTKINLKGLAVGNGLTDPAIQYGESFITLTGCNCMLDFFTLFGRLCWFQSYGF